MKHLWHNVNRGLDDPFRRVAGLGVVHRRLRRSGTRGDIPRAGILEDDIASFLAMVVSMNFGGCTQRQVSGRAPTAPALQPVSTRVYSVRLGTLESPAGQKTPSRYDQEFPDESVAATPQD